MEILNITLSPQNWQAAATSASQFFSIFLFFGSGLDQVFVILRWIAATAFVALLAYYVTRMMALSRGRGRKGGNLRVVESISLGNNSVIHLVKAADKYLVIGVTRENISLLGELDEEDVTIEEQVLFDPKDTPFGKVLARFMPKSSEEPTSDFTSESTLEPTSLDESQNRNGSKNE